MFNDPPSTAMKEKETVGMLLAFREQEMRVRECEEERNDDGGVEECEKACGREKRRDVNVVVTFVVMKPGCVIPTKSLTTISF